MQRGSSHLGGKAERVEINLGKVPVTPCAVLGKMKEEHGWFGCGAEVRCAKTEREYLF